MAPAQREATKHGECRRCGAFCDKLIEPRGCIELGCPQLYSYVDHFTGNRYMGCLRKVFRAEVDVEMFELAERSGGYGGLKLSRQPLPQCQFTVETAYDGQGQDFACVNPRFFDCSEAGPDGFRAFDLRNAL